MGSALKFPWALLVELVYDIERLLDLITRDRHIMVCIDKVKRYISSEPPELLFGEQNWSSH